jgi:hypothetical protein
MCFLGYSNMHKGFKCLDVSTGQTYIFRDVVFDENIFPFAKLHPNAGAQLRYEILLLPPSLHNGVNIMDEPVANFPNCNRPKSSVHDGVQVAVLPCAKNDENLALEETASPANAVLVQVPVHASAREPAATVLEMEPLQLSPSCNSAVPWRNHQRQRRLVLGLIPILRWILRRLLLKGEQVLYMHQFTNSHRNDRVRDSQMEFVDLAYTRMAPSLWYACCN